MLYGYPIEATTDNWFHDCLCATLRSIHADLDSGDSTLRWPDIIPEPHRAGLRRRTGLRDRLTVYLDALAKLPSAGRVQTLRALEEENDIAHLLSGASDCDTVRDLPEIIRVPTSSLFEFAFELLGDLGVRDSQYQQIYDARPSHVCPFCGCEPFDFPTAPRESLDHYLPKSLYPFAAANLRNLVPMGHKCNSIYKRAQNILTRADGTRRRAIDPYLFSGTSISLERSQPFADLENSVPTPQWQIDFEPYGEEVATWDEVFRVRQRYERDVLQPHFRQWVDDFREWWRKDTFGKEETRDIIGTLKQYVGLLEVMSNRGPDFLRLHVFQMLYKNCHDGHQRLIAFLRSITFDTIDAVDERRISPLQSTQSGSQRSGSRAS